MQQSHYHLSIVNCFPYLCPTNQHSMKFLQNDTLVAVMNSVVDFEIAQNHHWYRIPVDSAPPIVRNNEINLDFL